jgi:hypothetical protein
MAAGSDEALTGRWVHSHEEDSDDAMVFRRAGYAFPRSRGRTSFELHEDGSYVERSPGPVDAPVESSGTWALEAGRLVLGADGDDAGHAWEVQSAGADRLVVKP